MAHFSLWRRLLKIGHKRQSFYESQHALRSVINLEVECLPQPEQKKPAQNLQDQPKI